MNPLINFLKFIIVGLVAIGFYFGLTVNGAIASRSSVQEELEYIPNPYYTYPQFNGSSDNFRVTENNIHLLACQVMTEELAKIEADLDASEAMVQSLQIKLSKKEAEIRQRDNELNHITRELTDSVFQLNTLRGDHQQLLAEYDLEVEKQIALQVKYDQQAAIVKQQEQDLSIAKRRLEKSEKEVRLYLFILSGLVLLIMFGIIAYKFYSEPDLKVTSRGAKSYSSKRALEYS